MFQHFLDPQSPIVLSKNRLPHWQQRAATYFITFRLADSIPHERLSEWNEQREIWLRFNPPPWTHETQREYLRRFPRRIEHWLDALEGSCVLRHEAARRIVTQALMHFDGVRHQHYAWIVMPNHVHTLVSVCEGWSLNKVVQGWKGFSAREINRFSQRTGTLWQKDYFDRLVRNEQHFRRCARYIRRNAANLPKTAYSLWETEFVRQTIAA